MPYYPLQCTFKSCLMEFEHFTTPALYARSKNDGFRDVRCTYCGSFGAQRIYPADSAPANLTVKGTWGKHASPGLKGKEYYTKQERDRQLASVGSSGGVYDGEGSEPQTPSSTKTYKADKDGKIKLVKRQGKKLVPVDSQRKPAELIKEYAANNNGVVDFAGLAEKTKVDKRKLQGGILGALRQGWLEKTEAPRVYRLS
tara:strand:+ start:7028 stop:7624 length:597 start_codon:yes stop_codon:yes gene_type:complete